MTKKMTRKRFCKLLMAHGVNRNTARGLAQCIYVARRYDFIDGFTIKLFNGQKYQVALLAEGVDRNSHQSISQIWISWSPSSRRAWIEIASACRKRAKTLRVALLAEGVDRNR